MQNQRKTQENKIQDFSVFCGQRIKEKEEEEEMGSSSKTVRKLEVVSPVPADIDIANSVQPLHISQIAQELNLSPDHYDLYGKYKAKVILTFMCICLNESFQLVLFFLSVWISRKLVLGDLWYWVRLLYLHICVINIGYMEFKKITFGVICGFG